MMKAPILGRRIDGSAKYAFTLVVPFKFAIKIG